MWRVLADGAEVFDNTYDLAVAYIEGGAAYYVAKHVKAKRKIAFLHIDFNLAGYSRMLDEDCYLQFDKVYAISQEVRDTFENVYPECKSKTELFNNIINREEIIKLAKQGEGFKDNYSGVRILTLGRLTSQKNFAVSIEAMKLAIEKAKKSGMAVVSVKNSNHFGIAGYYAKMACDQGLIGFAMTNSEAIMVPTYARKAMLGSNPIAISMPAEPYPFFFDSSTTVVPQR